MKTYIDFERLTINQYELFEIGGRNHKEKQMDRYLKCFEKSANGKITEADWSQGSIFISSGIEHTQTTRTFIINKKPKHVYCVALSEKNARRIFNRRNQ